MGNKISPNILRLGINKQHDSEWFSSRNFAEHLKQDWMIRDFLKSKFQDNAGLVKIFIARSKGIIEIVIKCLHPSVIIGKKGGEINQLVLDLQNKFNEEVKIKIFDIKKPEINATAIALKIAEELKRKGSSAKRIIKKYIQLSMKAGALGVRIACKGRIGGVEIARTDWMQEGSIPRHKLRANIDYSSIASHAKWGTTGVKVWIYLGDLVTEKKTGRRKYNVKS